MATDTQEKSLEPLSLSSYDQRLVSLEKQLDIEQKVGPLEIFILF